MTVRPCAEGDELAVYGADCSGCMTVKTFETALHAYLDVPKRKNRQTEVLPVCWEQILVLMIHVVIYVGIVMLTQMRKWLGSICASMIRNPLF